VSARVSDEAWDVALELIMSAHGYVLIRNPDGSISISSRPEPGRDSIDEVQRSSAAPQAAAAGLETRVAASTGGRAENREISGRVVEEGSGTPIAAAEVSVIGRQAIGESNRACTNERGEFRMRVPDGEVWLDASAPTFDFHRVTLGPADTTAEFRGTRNAKRPLAGISRDEIESVEVIKGASAAALYGADAAGGVIIIKTRRGQRVLPASAGLNIPIHLAAGSASNAPLLIVDGAVVNGDNVAPVESAVGCHGQAGTRLQFRLRLF
jgi:TonB-dependent SusC/RagA subfamily outer membrane receptor